MFFYGFYIIFELEIALSIKEQNKKEGVLDEKYADAFLVIIGLLIIVGTVVCYLFYNLNSTTMYVICGIVLVIMVLLLYIRNYKNNHYGGKFKNDFPDAH